MHDLCRLSLSSFLPGPMAGQRGQIMVRRTGYGAMFARNADGQVEVWTAEELVMELALNNRLGGDRSVGPLRCRGFQL